MAPYAWMTAVLEAQHWTTDKVFCLVISVCVAAIIAVSVFFFDVAIYLAIGRVLQITCNMTYGWPRH